LEAVNKLVLAQRESFQQALHKVSHEIEVAVRQKDFTLFKLNTSKESLEGRVLTVFL
jgi:hypothetical protein